MIQKGQLLTYKQVMSHLAYPDNMDRYALEKIIELHECDGRERTILLAEFDFRVPDLVFGSSLLELATAVYHGYRQGKKFREREICYDRGWHEFDDLNMQYNESQIWCGLCHLPVDEDLARIHELRRKVAMSFNRGQRRMYKRQLEIVTRETIHDRTEGVPLSPEPTWGLRVQTGGPRGRGFLQEMLVYEPDPKGRGGSTSGLSTRGLRRMVGRVRYGGSVRGKRVLP